jgi:vacuolar-type H+-ATPase subunit H
MAATTAAVIGIVSTTASTAMSFAQASKQQKNIREAEATAAKAMEEARNKLQVNYYDQLAIQKEPYELQREALLSSGSQAIQAAQEGDRGAAAAAGRVQMAQNEAQAGVRTAMGKELSDLERLSATEDSRLRDIGVQLDMGEIAGAQQAMSDAEQARAASMAQGFQGIASLAQQSADFFPLYMESKASKALGKSEAAYNKAITDNKLPTSFMKDGKPMSYQEASALAFNNPDLKTLKQNEFTDAMTKFGAKKINAIDWTQAPQMMSNQQNQQQAGNIQNYGAYEYFDPLRKKINLNVNPNISMPPRMGGQYNLFDWTLQPTAPAPAQGFNFGKYGE